MGGGSDTDGGGRLEPWVGSHSSIEELAAEMEQQSAFHAATKISIPEKESSSVDEGTYIRCTITARSPHEPDMCARNKPSFSQLTRYSDTDFEG